MPSPRPQLYTTDAARPQLCAKRCRACGYTFFPPHAYSCESCGAAAGQIEPQLLDGSGVLHASATVHVHHDPATPTPFTVASISLDDGPTIRALMTCPTDAELSLGDRVRAVLVPTGPDADGNAGSELRFEKTLKVEAS